MIMDGSMFGGSVGLEEDEFIDRFERCEYPNEMFKHSDHIRLAWSYIRRFGADAAEIRIGVSIRRFAASVGHKEKYHETMTRGWLRLVNAAYLTTPCASDFSQFITSHLWLLDRKALLGFYSEELLKSDAARSSWVEPDLRPLPDTVPAFYGTSSDSDIIGAEFDLAHFKQACSLFPTGVTVVARLDNAGHPRGLTVSSFVSVSLAPPVVLIGVRCGSAFLNSLKPGDSYSINVLDESQASVSELFAVSEDAMVTLWFAGIGVPFIERRNARRGNRDKMRLPPCSTEDSAIPGGKQPESTYIPVMDVGRTSFRHGSREGSDTGQHISGPFVLMVNLIARLSSVRIRCELVTHAMDS